jgi:hypothetical protein
LFPPVNEGDASIIDIDAVREVAKVSSQLFNFIRVLFQRFNVTEESVTESLLGDDPHERLSVAYNLIVDNKVSF